jgi:hypothetical protein
VAKCQMIMAILLTIVKPKKNFFLSVSLAWFLFLLSLPPPRGQLSNGPSLTEKPHLTMAAPPSFSL